MRRRVRLLVALVALIALGVGAGAAYAYFTSHGSGTGSASTGTLQPVKVAAVTGTPSTPLLPGHSADVILSINNPNSFTVTLNSVSGNGVVTADSGHPTCTTTGVAFNTQSGLSINLPTGTTQVDLPGAASMSTSSSNGCQAARFSVPVSITVHQG